MGFLGILNGKVSRHAPGTVVLDDETKPSIDALSQLKHDTGKNKHIILVPQPSDDPNDPLNWPRPKKYFVFVILLWGATIYGGCNAALLNSSMRVIAETFRVSLTRVALLSGEMALVVACTSPFVSAMSRKFGKRPMFLTSGLLGTVGTIICETATTLAQLRAGRIIVGFANVSFESIVLAAIGDMFFVHERGPFVAATNLMFVGLSSLVSVVSGPVITNLGWRYQFHLIVTFMAAQFLLTLLFVPEMSYDRDQSLNIDETIAVSLEELGPNTTKEIPAALECEKIEHVENVSPALIPKKLSGKISLCAMESTARRTSYNS